MEDNELAQLELTMKNKQSFKADCLLAATVLGCFLITGLTVVLGIMLS